MRYCFMMFEQKMGNRTELLFLPIFSQKRISSKNTDGKNSTTIVFCAYLQQFFSTLPLVRYSLLVARPPILTWPVIDDSATQAFMVFV